jgi:hypothetical protein
VEPFRGGWNNTRWPQNLRLRWLYASRMSRCGLSFYRSLFSSFSFPFPPIPLFFFSASVTVRQSQFRFPFVPVTCRNVIFFSSFPQPFSFVLVCPTFEILFFSLFRFVNILKRDNLQFNSVANVL